MPTNAEVLAGVVRSIKRAVKRHDAGIINDVELVEKVNIAISRLDCARPFTDEEKAQHTKSEVLPPNVRLEDLPD